MKFQTALELDTASCEVEVPADLAAARDANPAAKQVFDALSYCNKRGHVLVIEEAKTAETRWRRIEGAHVTARVKVL